MMVIITIAIFFIVVWAIVFYLTLRGSINPHRSFSPKVYENFYYNTVPDKEMPKVISGLHKASETRCIIAALSRDNEKRIAKSLDNMVKIGSSFKDYRIVIYENDSSDRTRDIIEEAASKNSKIDLIECDVPRCKFGSSKAYADGLASKSRMEKMAVLRNRYLEHVYEKYSDWDYVFICDLDMEGVFFRNGFFHALNETSKYSSVTANGIVSWAGIGIQSPYDGMAYSRHPGFEKRNVVSKFLLQYFDTMGMKECLDVESAFNGGAIYVLKDLIGLKYTADYGCEHNSVNYALRANGKKICIDPFFVVYAGNQGHF
jgi:hypothetical protein